MWVGPLQSVMLGPHGCSPSGSRMEPQAWQGCSCTHYKCACSLVAHGISQVHVGEPSGRHGHAHVTEHTAQQPLSVVRGVCLGILSPVSCSQGLIGEEKSPTSPQACQVTPASFVMGKPASARSPTSRARRPTDGCLALQRLHGGLPPLPQLTGLSP